MQDWKWQSNAYVSSHSNLQALREIDARGVSFLRANDGQLLESPESSGQLAGASDSSTASCYVPPARERCSSEPCTRVMAKPLTCQVGFNVA